jgi:hypothetical protein
LLRKANQQRLNAMMNGEEGEGLTVQPMDREHLAFIVLPGNNSGLIKDALLRRSWKWRECTSQ